MRLLIFLAFVLGLFVFLTVQYSFWVAFGAMEFGGMLATAVIAFAVRGRQPFTSSELVLNKSNAKNRISDNSITAFRYPVLLTPLSNLLPISQQ
ncbi:MAG: hypothetical protein IH613_01355 [Desulfuromonadales bacterium]|nr:hypothetical protein [Desulfuromonadales bacterium]